MPYYWTDWSLRNLQRAVRAIERKIKLSQLAMEISEASSPFSTNITHVILCLARKGIYLPPKGWARPCAKAPSTPPRQYPTHSPTKAWESLPRPNKHKPLTHKQAPFKKTNASARCKELLEVSSYPQGHAAAQTSLLSRTVQAIRAYCVSKYSRTQPEQWKSWFKNFIFLTLRGLCSKGFLLGPD